MLSHSAMSGGPAPQKDWTVLFYGGGVNNLDSDIKESWQSLKGSELPENVDTFVRHIDKNGDMTDYQLDAQGQAEQLSTRKDVNSADPQVLSEFLTTGMAQCPAKRYLVIVSSHGQGAQGVIEDDKTSKIMSPEELRAALETAKASNEGQAIDAVLFDACQMAALEMACQLVGVAGVAIASMDNIGNAGYNLKDILNSASAAETGKTLGENLVANDKVQQLENCNSLSAIELAKLGPLRSAVKDLGQSLTELTADDRNRVRDIVKSCRRNVASPMAMLGNEYLADNILEDYIIDQQLLELWLKNEEPGQSVSLLGLVQDFLADEKLCLSNPKLKAASLQVQEAHDVAVFAHRASDFEDEVGGLSIRFPLKNEPGPLYSNSKQELHFAQETQWEKAYDSIVPEGQDIPRPQTWLEAELGLSPPTSNIDLDHKTDHTHLIE